MNDIKTTNKDIHLAILDPDYRSHAIKVYDLLIANNYSVYWNYKYNLKKSLSIANEKKANYIIIVGENEYKKNNFSIKNLFNGDQEIRDMSNILDFIK